MKQNLTGFSDTNSDLLAGISFPKISAKNKNDSDVSSKMKTDVALFSPNKNINLNSLVNKYFKNTPRLNNYSVLKINDLKIVVEQDADWVQKSLDKYFKTQIDRLSLTEVLGFLKFKAEKLTAKNLNGHLGLKSNLANNDLYFFDKDIEKSTSKLIALPIIAQLIFEKYTDFQTRIAKISIDGKETFVVLMKEFSDQENYLIIDPHVMKINAHLSRVRDLSDVDFKLIDKGVIVTHPPMLWNDANRAITIIANNGKEIHFKVSGRTPTEKRFKKEDAIIKNADNDALVPIEIYFLPYYRPLGHTALRIGESLYELSMKGWKLHGDGNDSARAFLFNNPFFKNQYALLSKFGMPPVSFGKTILVKKENVLKLQEILTNLIEVKTSKENKFNILTNNCNQGVMRVLTAAGIDGFIADGYIAFSSVLSFRRFLLENKHQTEAHFIYPLPNTQFNDLSLRKYIPHLIYRENSIGKEFRRTFPRYIHNILYVNYNFVKKKISSLITGKQNEENE